MRIFESKALGIPLLPFSAIYLAAWGLRRLLYTFGLRRPACLNAYVISVGNLTVGGSGKTPFLLWLGEELLARGMRVAVVSRGWRRRSRGPRVISDGSQLLSDVYEAGDEPYLIARRLPGAAVLVDRRRSRAGRMAIEQYGAQVVLLDDAFQHWSLARDLDVVLIDCQFGLGNGYLLPAGPLREPAREVRRADEIVLARRGPVRPSSQRPGEKIVLRSGRRATLAELRPLACVRAKGGAEDCEWLRGRRVFAVAAIASPGQFFATLREMGAEVVGQRAFPDHHWFRPGEVAAIQDQARRAGAEAVLTTEKDLVRAEPLLGDPAMPWWAVRIELSPRAEDRPHWETLFRGIIDRLEGE
ncbi:MAG: tetraacyldisaccharide 4'-kinase [candidate division KSB1 bacterium]|nr:tetraacyldisaccharide 4'-kinase [candidate division KSB1 bacterium]